MFCGIYGLVPMLPHTLCLLLLVIQTLFLNNKGNRTICKGSLILFSLDFAFSLALLLWRWNKRLSSGLSINCGSWEGESYSGSQKLSEGLPFQFPRPFNCPQFYGPQITRYSMENNGPTAGVTRPQICLDLPVCLSNTVFANPEPDCRNEDGWGCGWSCCQDNTLGSQPCPRAVSS